MLILIWLLAVDEVLDQLLHLWNKEACISAPMTTKSSTPSASSVAMVPRNPLCTLCLGAVDHELAHGGRGSASGGAGDAGGACGAGL